MSLAQDVVSVSAIQKELPVERTYLMKELARLKALGLIALNKSIKLTAEGRKALTVVLAGGVFDIIHAGHLYTLSKAKQLGDVLVVVIATDRRVLSLKGRHALHSADLRKELVSALKCVDVALIGSEGSIFDTVVKLKPDIIALGYDQAHDEQELALKCREMGLNTRVVRIKGYVKGVKTSRILRKLYRE
ncbi:MAG: cytidyltransferase [Nitrososphaerota archaeon]